MKSEIDKARELGSKLEQLLKEGKQNTPEYEKLSDDYQTLAMCLVEGNILDQE